MNEEYFDLNGYFNGRSNLIKTETTLDNSEIISPNHIGMDNGLSPSIYDLFYTHTKQSPNINKNKLPLYSSDDMDNLIEMLTVWIDDRNVIEKMEKMYKHWKAIQNK